MPNKKQTPWPKKRNFFISLIIQKSFQKDEEWHLFYYDSTLGCWVIQDFDLSRLHDLWRHPKWYITEQNLEYLHASTESTGLKFCRVDVLEDLHIVIALRLYHRNKSYSLPDLYLPKMKTALVKQTLLCLWCVMSIFDSLTPTEWTTRANNTSWRRKMLIFPFEWRGPGVHCVGMEMSEDIS